MGQGWSFKPLDLSNIFSKPIVLPAPTTPPPVDNTKKREEAERKEAELEKKEAELESEKVLLGKLEAELMTLKIELGASPGYTFTTMAPKGETMNIPPTMSSMDSRLKVAKATETEYGVIGRKKSIEDLKKAVDLLRQQYHTLLSEAGLPTTHSFARSGGSAGVELAGAVPLNPLAVVIPVVIVVLIILALMVKFAR